MKKVFLLLFDGVEEIEAVTCIDILRRANIEVLTLSVSESITLKGRNEIKIQSDAHLKDHLHEVTDMLILPGGPGVEKIKMDEDVLSTIRNFEKNGKYVAAICAAPLVLEAAGIVAEAELTSFPGAKKELENKVSSYCEERVVVDGKLITSRGAGTAEEFALTLVAILEDESIRDKVAQSIVARTSP